MAREQTRPHQKSLPRRKPSSLIGVNSCIPVLFLATIIVAFLIMMSGSDAKYLRYTTVTGFFQQDDPSTDPKGFDYSTTNFGLIDREYDTDAEYDPDKKKTQWQRFEYQVSQLNKAGGSKAQYKLLYMGRHGEGYHNLAESFYGTHDWDCYWSLQDGNSTSTWADALLTPTGTAQALHAHTFWASMLQTQHLPAPESYYTSPLTRCLQTAALTFTGLNLPPDRPFAPVIKERLREVLGVHTCDRRSSRAHIHELYPEWAFEKGFVEEDPLWEADVRETPEAQDVRTLALLDDVWGSDGKTYLSFSSHSGEIASVLRVVGHRKFQLGTGHIIPVLVKAETVYGTRPVTPIPPSTPVSTCTKPSATSTL